MSHAILLTLVPVFFVMALGYGAGRLRIVDNRQVDSLNALVMDFALPASLFVASASATRSQMFEQAPLFAVFGGVMLVLFAGWYFAARAWKVDKADASLQALTIAFPNLAGVGLPIVSAVLGPTGTVPVAVALAAGSILVSPLTLILVEMDSKKKDAPAGNTTARMLNALRRAVTRPVVLAPALGILIALLDLKLGPIAEACLRLIGHAAAGVALFLTGLILSAQAFRLNWRVVGATGVADIVRPLLTAAVVLVFPVSAELAKVAVLLAAVPAGFFGILFAVSYRLDSATTGSMVFASTGFSIVTMAIAIAVLSPA